MAYSPAVSAGSFRWVAAGAIAIAVAAQILWMPQGSLRGELLPGPSSAGHRQIQSQCTLCHKVPFPGPEDFQSACVECHGDELRDERDSHSRYKFTDPRNAAQVAELDARYCVTCHTEHAQEIVHAMGVTLPDDFCYRCHADVVQERPSHRNADFASCGTVGCHNYHDNRALYEDFERRHLDEPDVLASASNPTRSPIRAVKGSLSLADQDGPADLPGLARAAEDWVGSSHARAGVNCSDCHAYRGAAWSNRVAEAACARCHDRERKSFERGRHGMRIGAGLKPMRPRKASLEMRATARNRELGCNSCHSAHAFDTREAEVQACLGCHADAHSRAYRDSAHYAAWQSQKRPEAAVSCATCHLPRTDSDGGTWCDHDQSENLRPSEKMLGSVCLRCHGLGFSLDALADPGVVRGNFRDKPAVHVPSLDWVRRRMAADSHGKEHR